MIDHLRRLGITAIELMPVHAFLQDRALQQRGLRNYWGYNTLGFFAPEPTYLSDGSPNEMRVAVRRLHAAGIEVILDVVYNHTAEGDETGPTLSFRGLDNASYYRLEAGDPRRTVNDTGTGNTLNLSHPRVLQMVMDSLRYWVNSFHVDGFRFDLCATLGREANGFDPGAGFFDALRQDPVLAGVKLIAEPWDIGPGGYQLGNHPPGFAEWNDRFRDGVRRFWRGDAGQRPAIAARLAGSADMFAPPGPASLGIGQFRRLRMTGSRCTDAVSYVERHNEANGEDNRDGHPANFTSNWGVEGPTDDPAINAVRDRVQARDAGHRVLRRRHADAAGRRRVRPHPGRQQQCLLPGQRNVLAGLEHGGVAAGSCADRLRGAADRAPPRASGAAPSGFPARQGASRAGHRRHRVVRPVGRNNSSRGVERYRATDVDFAPIDAKFLKERSRS